MTWWSCSVNTISMRMAALGILRVESLSREKTFPWLSLATRILVCEAEPAAQSRTALTKRRRPKSSKDAIARCGSPVVKAHGSPSGVILCWNHFTRDLSGLGTSEHQPPTHAWSACLPAPASDAPVHGSVGANGDASGNLWLKSFCRRMARARTSFGGLPEVVQAFFQLQKGWRKGFVNGHAEVAH